MSDGFSLVLAKNDLNANVGIDPHIFDNDNTSS